MGRLLLVHVTAFVITQEQCKLTPFVHKPFHNWGPELELSGSHLLPFGVHPFCCRQQPYIEEILIKTCLTSVTILSVLLQKTPTLPYWGFFVWKPLFAQLEIPVELHSFLLKVLSFELPAPITIYQMSLSGMSMDIIQKHNGSCHSLPLIWYC